MQKQNMKTRHATHPKAVPMVGGEGATWDTLSANVPLRGIVGVRGPRAQPLICKIQSRHCVPMI